MSSYISNSDYVYITYICEVIALPYQLHQLVEVLIPKQLWCIGITAVKMNVSDSGEYISMWGDEKEHVYHMSDKYTQCHHDIDLRMLDKYLAYKTNYN